MEKIPEKNIKETNNDENKITNELDLEIKDDLLEFNENNLNDFLFNEKNSESLSSKKRNRNENLFSFPEFDDFEDFNLFNNQHLEKPKKNIKLKTVPKNRIKQRKKSKLYFSKKKKNLNKFFQFNFFKPSNYSPLFL